MTPWTCAGSAQVAAFIPPPTVLMRGAGERREAGGLPASDAGARHETRPRHLLCKACLHRITSDAARVEVRGKHLHVFCNPHGLVFEIGCFAEAPGCALFGPPTHEFTWFPGYNWQVALCLDCRAHLGWRYVAGHTGAFHGLILDRLLGE